MGAAKATAAASEGAHAVWGRPRRGEKLLLCQYPGVAGADRDARQRAATGDDADRLWGARGGRMRERASMPRPPRLVLAVDAWLAIRLLGPLTVILGIGGCADPGDERIAYARK